MRKPVIALALGAMISAGCFTVQPPAPAPAPSSVSAWGPLGGFAVNYGNCAGHVTLVNGFATVTDPCFDGNNNVVVCTDSTAPNPVKCSPMPGSLLISGAGSDVIAYGRLK